MPDRTLYEILMVDARADMGIITLVYHALAKRYHPDRNDVPDAVVRMSEINGAYAVLSDPSSRDQYDRSIGLPSHLRQAARLAVIPIETASGAPTVDGRTPVPRSGFGEAGEPPPYPRPSGTTIAYGRYRGWALNQVDSYDPNYIEWLQRAPAGRMYAAEIGAILRGRVPA